MVALGRGSANHGARRDRAGLEPPPRTGALLLAATLLITLTLLGPLMSFSDFPGAGEGSPARQGAYATVFLLTLYGIRPYAAPRRILAVPTLILVALAWCWLSLSWAVVPDIALRRLLLTTILIWSIFAIVNAAGVDRTLLIMRALMVTFLIVNVIVSIALPEIGQHTVNEVGDKNLVGDWRGIMMHKNSAGPIAALTILLFLFDARRIPLWLKTSVVGTSTFFLYMTQSKTSAGICVFAIAIGFIFQFYKKNYRPLIIIAIMLIGMSTAVVVYIYRNPLAGNFTDPRSFTGRPAIWQAVVEYWRLHPWTGSGYGSFWNVGPNGPIFQHATGWVTTIGQGHNGFLDLLAQIGIPGLALVLAAAVVYPFYLVLRNDDDRSDRTALILAMIAFCVGHNSTESSLFDRDAIPQVFLMFAIAFAMGLSERGGLPFGRPFPDRPPLRQ